MFTKKYLEKYVVYDPDTGFFHRRKTGHHLTCKNPSGYIVFKVGKYKAITAGRAAWIIYNNAEIPDGFVVDHINGVRDDNKISNLRLIRAELNQHNTKRRIDRIKGNHGGMMVRDGKFLVQFQHNKQKMSFGTYKDELEANLIYIFVKRHYCEFYNGNDLPEDHPAKIIGFGNLLPLVQKISTAKGVPATTLLKTKGIL